MFKFMPCKECLECKLELVEDDTKRMGSASCLNSWKEHLLYQLNQLAMVFAAWSSDPDLDTFSSLALAVDVSLVFKHFDLPEDWLPLNLRLFE